MTIIAEDGRNKCDSFKLTTSDKTKISLKKRAVRVSARAFLDEGTFINAVTRFPLLFFQWPYLGGMIFFASIFFANVVLGNVCDTPPTEAFHDPEDVISKNFLAAMNSTAYVNAWQSHIKDALVCGTHTRGFSLGKTERIIMWLLSLVGIIENVMPNYINKKVAQRHMGQRTANRALLFHIAAGISTVLGNGLVGILLGGFSSNHSGFLFWFLAMADLYHQLSILLLVKNHDGIYALRPGNLTLSVLKFIALVNHSRHTHGSDLSDVWFTASFGFLGTRLAALGFAVAVHFVNKDGKGLQNEDWYSFGLTFVQLLVIVRIPDAAKVFLFVSPVSAYLFYHELWDKSRKATFVAWNIIYSVLCLTFLKSPNALYVGVAIYYYLAGFGFYKKRFYRQPKTALKDTKEETNIDRRRSMMRRNSTWKTSFKSVRNVTEE